MNQISEHIYIEDEFPGVVCGALSLSHGVVMVDAPLQDADIGVWRGRLANLGGGVDKLLVLLDTHLDRSHAVQSMGVNILCHDKAEIAVKMRANASHNRDSQTGAAWEMQNLDTDTHDWNPDFTYSAEVALYWNNDPIFITHHMGSHLAASWLRYEPEKIVFVGDSLVCNQPPFLAWSDLDMWLDDLYLLQSDAFADYRIISGRNGLLGQEDVDQMISFLMAVRNEIGGLYAQKHQAEAIESAVYRLLDHLNFDPQFTGQYRQRLQWGVTQYLLHHSASDTSATK